MTWRRAWYMTRTYPQFVWWAIHAHFSGLRHWAKGHDVHWYEGFNPWGGFLGWISCHNCPDSEEGNSVYFWGRDNRALYDLAIWLCGKLGHPGVEPIRLAKKSEGGKWLYDENDDPVFENSPDRVGCTRCMAEWVKGEEPLTAASTEV